MSALLTLEEAQARLLALAPEMPQALPGGAPFGETRYLSQDIVALRTQPDADLSAMDGYAIAGEGPWQMVGESRAGRPYAGTIRPGECTRISTGAHIPAGADRVLIQENAVVDGAQVALAAGEATPEAGRHVRKAGFDFREGDVLLQKGTRIGPGQLALARAAGYDAPPHYETPRIAVLESGDELSPNANPCMLEPGHIPASNGAMIEAMLAPYLGEVVQIGAVPDSLSLLADALGKAEDCHIVITSGGASVGDHDLIQQALKDWGAEIAFWKVAIKPGKPLMVATREGSCGRQVILGLPGNPVSSFVTAFLFALPLVRKAMGAADPLPRRHMLTAAEPLPATSDRREFLRGVSDGTVVRLAGSQDSSALLALAQADCLIDRPADAPAVSPGEQVPVFYLQNG
jgi:molybdopterin molybdotransferase